MIHPVSDTGGVFFYTRSSSRAPNLSQEHIDTIQDGEADKKKPITGDGQRLHTAIQDSVWGKEG